MSIRFDGYGQLTRSKKVHLAHRLSFELSKGPIPEGMHVCHSCDNRRCINPDHLWLGTNLDNLRDMFAKGRNPPRKKSHCKRGHIKTPETAYYLSNGEVICKECHSAYKRKLYASKKNGPVRPRKRPTGPREIE